MIKLKPIEEEKLKKKLIPFLLGAAILALGFSVFRSSLLSLLKLRVENNRQENKSTALSQKIELLQTLDAVDLEEKVKKLEEVFPSEKPVLNLLASLIQLSRDEGVIFGGLELKPGEITEEKEAEKLEEFLINFTIQGELAKITSFINHLEETAPLMKIEEMSLSLEGPQVSLGVKVYYQALPESLGPIDQPLNLLSEEEKAVLAEILSYRQIKVIKSTAPAGKSDLFSLLSD
jgi:Tfp pilus assembly protein PilO